MVSLCVHNDKMSIIFSCNCVRHSRPSHLSPLNTVLHPLLSIHQTWFCIVQNTVNPAAARQPVSVNPTPKMEERCGEQQRRSQRLSRCPSEVARVGGRGGRRLLTIWIVLLANPQQTGEALTDGRRVRAPWLGARAGIPAGTSPIWVSPSREMVGWISTDEDAESDR